MHRARIEVVSSSLPTRGLKEYRLKLTFTMHVNYSILSLITGGRIMTEKTTLSPSELKVSKQPVGEAVLADRYVRNSKQTQRNSLRIAKRTVRETECIEEVIEAEWNE